MKILKNEKLINILKQTAGLIIGLTIGFTVTCSATNRTISNAEIKMSTQSDTITENEEEIRSLNNKLETAKPWFDMKEDERQKIKEDRDKAAQEKLDQSAKELQETLMKQEKAKKEEQAKQYDTGITYDQLARTPDDYKGSKVKFGGKVVQVLENGEDVEIRLAVDGNYDNIMYCGYNKSIVKGRVLEGDYINVKGVSAGILTYKSTLGGDITVPSMLANIIDFK